MPMPAILDWIKPLVGGKDKADYAAEPIVDFRSGRIIGHEILCRQIPFPSKVRSWRTWYRSMAVHLDSIDQFGLSSVFPGDGWISINLDTWQITDGPILKSVIRIAERFHASNRPLAIEWTERGPAMNRSEIGFVSRSLDCLRTRLGVLLILDDMGDGLDFHSKVSALRPDFGKIAGVLFHSGRDSHRARLAIGSIRDLLTKVGSHPVVEWIESNDDLRLADSLGLTLGQGHLWTLNPNRIGRTLTTGMEEPE